MTFMSHLETAKFGPWNCCKIWIKIFVKIWTKIFVKMSNEFITWNPSKIDGSHLWLLLPSNWNHLWKIQSSISLPIVFLPIGIKNNCPAYYFKTSAKWNYPIVSHSSHLFIIRNSVKIYFKSFFAKNTFCFTLRFITSIKITIAIIRQVV